MLNFVNDDNDKKDKQLENLENLVENHTRTERHLEQYSNIGNPYNKEHAREIQKIREEQIQDLESVIKDEDKYMSPEEHLQNLKDNYRNTENYIANNKASIDQQMLQNLQEKQKHRKEQIVFLQNKD